MEAQHRTYGEAWTKNHKFGVGGSFMVANDVSIPRECFAKISELKKKKLAEESAFLVYNVIYKNLKS